MTVTYDRRVVKRLRAAMAFPCSECGAVENVPCRRPPNQTAHGRMNTHRFAYENPHQARVRAANPLPKKAEKATRSA